VTAQAGNRREDFWDNFLIFAFLTFISSLGFSRIYGPVVLSTAIAGLVSAAIDAGSRAEQMLAFLFIGLLIGLAIDFLLPARKPPNQSM
jgi:hypothetical protein